jgi:hypothetical protein
MALLLIFMSGVISSYWFLTDPIRIRDMSQTYLSELIGGHVQVGSASLTVFEGLKLSHITVKVDQSGPVDDTTVFYADAIEIQYNPASLLRGRLEATRIIATGSKAQLVEDSAKGRWNYQRLIPEQPKHPVTRPTGKTPLQLPQVVLRDAQVNYSEIQGAKLYPRGSVDIEGRFFPSTDFSLYSFELQSRGQIEGVGPVVKGAVTLKTGQIVAALNRLRFGQDVEAMLPHEVRDFWVAHRVEGALDIPEFRYTPATENHRATFNVQTELEHVKLVVRAEEFDPPPQLDVPANASAWTWLSPTNAAQKVRAELYHLRALPQHTPMPVDDVSGAFFFDENGIHFDGLTGTIAGATLSVSGKIDGYSPDAPIWVRVESKPGQVVDIPRSPDFLTSLPSPLHEAYNMLKPFGKGTMWAELKRTSTEGMPDVKGEIDVVDGNFNCIFFPYPVSHATGKVLFAPDPTRTFVKITLQDLRGYGQPGGPNADRACLLNGWVGAMNPDVGCRIHASGRQMQSEPAIFAAFPPPVRKVMEIFKGPGDEKYPRFSGDFDCEVFVPPGIEMRPIVSVDLNFTDGSGRLTAFPYPLEQMKGTVAVRDGYVDVNDVTFKHGQSTVTVGGRVTWPVGLPPGTDVIAKPDLKIVAHQVPVDATLLKVLPPEASSWLRSVGATGLLDVDGKVLPKPDATSPEDSIAYNLNVDLRDGTAKPRGSNFDISAVTGKLVVHEDRLELLALRGKRGDSNINATGTVNWSTGGADVNIDGTGTTLKLEPALRDLLPPDAQAAWNSLDPHGILDTQIRFHGLWKPAAGQPIASVELPPNTLLAPPQPTKYDFGITLKPIDVSATPAPLPYKLDHCTGQILITPDTIKITDIHGTHGNAKIRISGQGITTNPNDWDLNLQALDLPVDDQLKTALPLPIRQVIDELKYTGQLSIDMTTFRYRGDKPDPDIDLAGTLSAANGSVDAGVPIEKIHGSMPFNAAVRNGKLAAFRSDLALDHLTMADRPMTDLKATLDLPLGSDSLGIKDIRGQLSDGEVSGNMDLKFPDVGPSSYSMDFAVKNADLRAMADQVAGKGQQIRGEMSASLALQGEWADPASRRGRGDVLVSGKEMYQIPLMLGLLEVTNLSLPTTTPFTEGTARYLVEGDRVTFEQVQMRSAAMVMSGNGWLDFGSKQVRMNFITENPNLPKLPLIHDLLQDAKQELLQIQVRGTVQSPKVSAASLHTFTTTVDEVLNGSGKEK